MSNRSSRHSYDPQIDPGNYLYVDCESEYDPYFVCDQDGPISHSDCDSGPYTVRADAEYELARFEAFLEDCYVSSRVD